MIISEELLNEVLNYDVKLSNIKIDGSSVIFNVGDRLIMSSINIYEVIHRCKKWVVSKGGEITSGYIEDDEPGWYCYASLDPHPYMETGITKTENTELEAVFKAAQWILENK